MLEHVWFDLNERHEFERRPIDGLTYFDFTGQKEDQHEDPATQDPELHRVLLEQGEEGRRRLEDFFDNFEQRQGAVNDENEATRGGEDEQNNVPKC